MGEAVRKCGDERLFADGGFAMSEQKLFLVDS